MVKKFLILLLGVFSLHSTAQTLKLKSGTYEISYGTYLGLSSKTDTYGALLWDHSITPEDKEAVATLGIELNHYLPKNAFEAKVPAGVTAAQLRKAGVASFVKWSPTMKLDAPLAQGDYPSWALHDPNHLEVLFLTTSDFSPLQEFGFAHTALLHDRNRWFKTIIHPNDLLLLAAHPHVLFIQAAEEPGSPENFKARAAARVSDVQTTQGWDGTGVVVGVGDDGDIGPHIDRKNRYISLAGPSLGDHGDHVTGTVMGAGNLDPAAMGMAPGATMIYSSYPDNLSNVDNHYSQYGVRVTNSSYSNGCNAGYTSYAQQMDKDVRDNAALVHVFSAGNSNGSNCGYGAGSQWGNITGGHKQGKNVVATANITAADLAAPSSSRGPAADGRIKPDLSSIGTQVYSTISNYSYANYTGTSMAAPGAAGFFAVLHGAFDSLQNATAPAGLLKAVAMNTADDLGNAGPDFTFGYGRINARRALETIALSRFHTDTLTQGDSLTFDFQVPSGATDVRAMLYWTDPEGSTFSSRALVNNLDLILEDPNGAAYRPWVLNPAANSITLGNAAVRGTDSLNNAEQVTIENPLAGTYVAKVYGTNIPTGPQELFLVFSYDTLPAQIVYPHTGAVIEPGTSTTIRWDGNGNNANNSWSISLDSGQTFSPITITAASGRNVASYTFPSTPTAGAYMRVQNGTSTHTVGPFTILAAPTNLSLGWVCPDSIKLNFSPVSGASSYTAHVLGTYYMDSIYTDTVSTSITFPYINTSGTWVSVRANMGSASGPRAYAIEVPTGLSNCPLARDASLQLIAPTSMSSCFSPQLDITVELNNPSTGFLDTIPVAYKWGTGGTIRDTFYGGLAPFTDSLFTFSVGYTWTGSAAQQLKVWTELPGDLNALNDTVNQTVNYINSSMSSLPFAQTFDGFFSCSTASDCEQTVCSLSGGFQNAVNGTDDDIDWRINSGATPSSGTGPNGGYGNTGKYLYLEASGTCEFQVARLTTPCIDLSGAIAPQLNLAYHMSGADMGDLQITATNGVYSEVLANWSGDQGSNWNLANLDLSSFAGDTIVIEIVGTTGGGYASDMAVDEVEIVDLIGVPVVDFSSSTLAPCLNGLVQLEDESVKTPTTWNWTISPSTHLFVGGTSATSQNPQVEFTAYGNYTITLVASNAYGSDTLIRTNYISVTPLSNTPVVEIFNGQVDDLLTVENTDNATTWAKTQVIGASGAYTNAAYMAYYNYNSPGTEDALVTPVFDISGMAQPALLFDLSYAPYSAGYADSMAVLVSSDCGYSFNAVYAKGGMDLSTAGTYTSTYVPGSKADWRTDTVLLSNLGGTQMQAKLTAYNGYGNHLYLDNIRVVDLSAGAPTATVVFPNMVCEDEMFSFEISTTDSTLQGAFVQNRQNTSLSAVFDGLGPHQTWHSMSSNYYYEVVYWNKNQFFIDSVLLPTGPKLSANWSLTQNTSNLLEYTFKDRSTPTPTAWFWDFGDGTTSTLQNPTHTFASGSTPHTIKLVVTTACGMDSLELTLLTIGMDEWESAAGYLYPNPASSEVRVKLPGALDSPIQVHIFDLSGSAVLQHTYPNAEAELTVPLYSLPSGTYTIQIISNKLNISTKLIKI